jgi:hypothetical protein
MTPHQVAKEFCANFSRGGRCVLKRCPCVLSQIGVRCDYFDEAVAPMAENNRWPGVKNQSDKVKELAEAVRSYQSQVTARRVCPDCNERELKPRHRFCDVCTDRRKRKSNRKRHSP